MKNHKEWGVVGCFMHKMIKEFFCIKQRNIVQYGYERNNNEWEWGIKNHWREIKLIFFCLNEEKELEGEEKLT